MNVHQIECPATASMILEECIKDIERGAWICESLTGAVPWGLDAKPEGCAIGLVGINGGAAKLRFNESRNWLEAIFTDEDGVSDNWPLKAKQAVILLAQALPDQPWNVDRYKPERLVDVENAASAVIEYNDYGHIRECDCDSEVSLCSGSCEAGNLDRSEALEWFRQAHARALEQRV